MGVAVAVCGVAAALALTTCSDGVCVVRLVLVELAGELVPAKADTDDVVAAAKADGVFA